MTIWSMHIARWISKATNTHLGYNNYCFSTAKVAARRRLSVASYVHCPSCKFWCASYNVFMSGIESRWGRDFPPVQTGPVAHPASCKMGTGSFPGVKCGRGVLLTTHPLLVPRSWKSRAILLPTLWATPSL